MLLSYFALDFAKTLAFIFSYSFFCVFRTFQLLLDFLQYSFETLFLLFFVFKVS